MLQQILGWFPQIYKLASFQYCIPDECLLLFYTKKARPAKRPLAPPGPFTSLSKANFHYLPWQVTWRVHFLQRWIRRLTWLVTKKVRNHTLVSQKMSNLSKANFHNVSWQVTWRLHFLQQWIPLLTRLVTKKCAIISWWFKRWVIFQRQIFTMYLDKWHEDYIFCCNGFAV